jgi:DNA polymerase-1
MPERVLDLFCEFRCLTNGRRAPGEKDSLVGALTYFSLDTIGALEKRSMIDLILADGPELELRSGEVLDYCTEDVSALERLLSAMLPHIDLPHALLRGRYMANGASAMEHVGIPVDAPLWERLVAQWDSIKRGLIDEVDADFHVYEDGVFRQVLFEKLLGRHNIPWPRLESGSLDLSDDIFRSQAKSYPTIISPLRELRHTLSELRLNRLSIGEDGYNRAILSAFRARTGRNQPSSARYIFGPSAWIRGLIKPKLGTGLAYIDWSGQEIGIAGASLRSSLAIYCATTATLIRGSGRGAMLASTSRCRAARYGRHSVGRSGSGRIRIRARFGIFRCKATALKCCASHVAWAPSAASRSADRCTMLC